MKNSDLFAGVASDRLTGGVLGGVGALAIAGASRLPEIPGQQIGPSVFPTVIGVGLIACGLMIAFGVGRRFEEDQRAELAAREEESAPAPEHGRLYQLRAFIPPLLLLFYAFAAERLGFVPTAALIVLVVARLFGASWRLALPLAVLAPLVVHLAFYKLLRVPLPEGLIPLPW